MFGNHDIALLGYALPAKPPILTLSGLSRWLLGRR